MIPSAEAGCDQAIASVYERLDSGQHHCNWSSMDRSYSLKPGRSWGDSTKIWAGCTLLVFRPKYVIFTTQLQVDNFAVFKPKCKHVYPISDQLAKIPDNFKQNANKAKTIVLLLLKTPYPLGRHIPIKLIWGASPPPSRHLPSIGDRRENMQANFYDIFSLSLGQSERHGINSCNRGRHTLQFWKCISTINISWNFALITDVIM